MTRFQQGYIYEAFNAFHVRYYQNAIIDGKTTRVQKSHKLVEKSTKYHSRACKAVRQKCEEFLRGINEQAVSYTHLDVYKRQRPETSADPLRTSSRAPRSASRNWTVVGFSPIGRCKEPSRRSSEAVEL